MPSVAEYSELVSGIYAAALEPTQWPEILERLRTMLGSTGVSFLASQPNLRRSNFVVAGWDAAQEQQYSDYYGCFDPVAPILERTPAGRIVTCREATCSQQRRSEFFNDWAHPYGVADAIFANLLSDDAGVIALVAGANWRSEPFPNPARIELLNLLLPHFQHALKCHLIIGDLILQRDQAFEALDRLRPGIVLIGSAEKILFANRAATDITAQSDGLKLGAGRLRAANTSEDAALQSMVRQASSDSTMQPNHGSRIIIFATFRSQISCSAHSAARC